MINEAAKVAAQWWADQLRRPPKMNSGDRAFDQLMQADSPEIIPAERIQLFQATLERKIIEAWEAGDLNSVLGVVEVEVDYEPSDNLKVAAKEADVRLPKNLPIKTFTLIKPGKVMLKHGYGAELQVIFGSDRPSI